MSTCINHKVFQQWVVHRALRVTCSAQRALSALTGTQTPPNMTRALMFPHGPMSGDFSQKYSNAVKILHHLYLNMAQEFRFGTSIYTPLSIQKLFTIRCQNLQRVRLFDAVRLSFLRRRPEIDARNFKSLFFRKESGGPVTRFNSGCFPARN